MELGGRVDSGTSERGREKGREGDSMVVSFDVSFPFVFFSDALTERVSRSGIPVSTYISSSSGSPKNLRRGIAPSRRTDR